MGQEGKQQEGCASEVKPVQTGSRKIPRGPSGSCRVQTTKRGHQEWGAQWPAVPSSTQHISSDGRLISRPLSKQTFIRGLDCRSMSRHKQVHLPLALLSASGRKGQSWPEQGVRSFLPRQGVKGFLWQSGGGSRWS